MNTRTLWFLNSLVTIHVSEADGRDGLSVIEHTVSHGDSPPLHLHQTEDEVFQILDGQFRFKVHDREQIAGAGAIFHVPKGTPHSYRVESPEGGRFLTTTAKGHFERFIRAIGRTPEHPGPPAHSGPPSPEAIQSVAQIAAQFGIEFVGPPLN